MKNANLPILDNMKFYCLYVHISPSNKLYFGITCQNPNVRWSDGEGYKYCPHLYAAIKKYGWNNFQHIVLVDSLSRNWAVKLEQHFIWKYRTNDSKYGYNMTVGGDGLVGISDETRKKMSNTRILYYQLHPMSDEIRRKIGQSFAGKKLSEETRRKISLAKKGKPLTYKRVVSEETRRKISETKQANPWHPTIEQRKRMGHPGRGGHNMPHSEKTKRLISEKSKGRVITEATREKLRQAAYKQWERQHAERTKNEI